MAPPKAILPLLNNVWFRTFIAGCGFFADSYDLFITDGVTNILKNLGPVSAIPYTWYDVNGSTYKHINIFFTFLSNHNFSAYYYINK